MAERRDPYETLYPPCLPGPVRRAAAGRQRLFPAGLFSGFHRFRKFCGKRSHAYAGARHRSSHSGTFHTHPGAHAFARAGELPRAAGDFEAAFADNPIDAQLEEDLSFASSNVLIQQAYSSAVDRWETLIQTAYAQAEEDLSPEAFSTLQAEQEAWEQGREASVQSLRTQNSEDPLAAAQAIIDLYRTRAQELCKASYEVTGQMPAFPERRRPPGGRPLKKAPPKMGELFCCCFSQALILLWNPHPRPGEILRPSGRSPPSSAVPSSSISSVVHLVLLVGDPGQGDHPAALLAASSPARPCWDGRTPGRACGRCG